MKDLPIVDRLTVLDRDITKQQVDAIVNAANSSLLATPKADRFRAAVAGPRHSRPTPSASAPPTGLGQGRLNAQPAPSPQRSGAPRRRWPGPGRGRGAN